MAKNKIEKTIIENINPLVEFLGAERVEDLKDKVCEMILNQIQQDLEDSYDFIITTSDVTEIAMEALEEITPNLKKKFSKAYSNMADEYINKLKGDTNADI